MNHTTEPIASTTRPSLIGARVARVEDARALTGQGRYIADVSLPGALDVAFVRSQVAHARIGAIDVDAALDADGVVAVVTAADLDGVRPVPDFSEIARPIQLFPLQRERVRYVGAPIAAVVAEDRYLAEDAVELIHAELEPLPAVVTLDAATAPGAPRLYDDWADNEVVRVPAGTDPAVEDAFARLRTVRCTTTMGRHGAVPLETRGVAARYEDGRLTVWTSTQLPHIARTLLARVLGIAERSIRVVAPDVGGGFGAKAEVYPEEYLVAWLALKLGRPVRWIEDRYENLLTCCQSRDMRVELEAAVHDDGRIEALRGHLWQDVGSGEMFPYGYTTGLVALGSLPGPYRIPLQAAELHCVVTNKTPSGAYRGFGAPEAVFATERLVDQIADELSIDRFEVRRRNLIAPDELPYTTATGARLDSGSHRAAFERAVELGEAELEAAHREHDDDPSLRLGLGVATFVDSAAATYFPTTGHWTDHESCALSIDPDGAVTVAVGISAYGQGSRTMIATLTAELLGVAVEDVRVEIGDTDTCPYGLGAWASRGTVVVAGALELATAPLREKGRRIAAHLLEAAPEDIQLGPAGFHPAGSPQLSVSWRDVAAVALARTFELPPDIDPGLESTATYHPPGIDHVPRPDGRMNAAVTYGNSTHAVVVGVDVRTGVVHLLRYVVLHDCGRVLNPLIVAGQIQGGVAQGIGGALYEDFAYDESGQPQSATFMDYLLPTAVEIPPMLLQEMESPAPETAFGVKGVGESGIIGPPAAIAGAVAHALGELAKRPLLETPITPERVLGLLDDGTAS